MTACAKIYVMLRLLLFAATILCFPACNNNSHAPVPEAPPQVGKAAATAEISSFTLASDCPDEKQEVKPEAEAPPDDDAQLAKMAYDPNRIEACEQTQLVMTITGARGSKVQLVSVSVKDKENTLGSSFTSRLPQKWDNEKYANWDELIGSEGKEKVSYKLSAPNWKESPPGGKDLIATVVVQIDSNTVTTTLPVVLMIEPFVET